MAKQTITLTGSICLTVFFVYCVCLFPFAKFFFFHLCCATTYVGKIKLYIKFCLVLLRCQWIASLSLVLLNTRVVTAVKCLKGVATLVQGIVFFSERVVGLSAWNSLPRDTNFNSVAGFKRSVAKVDFTTFLKSDFM